MPDLLDRLDVADLMHVAVWAALAAAGLCLAFQLAGDSVGRVLTTAQALTPWMLPVAVIATVAALLLDRRPAAATGVALSALLAALVVRERFGGGLPPAAGGRLTIAHANLLDENPTIDEAIAALTATDADVVAVSELTPAFATAFAASDLARTRPHSVVRPGDSATGLAVWSRHPISSRAPSPHKVAELTVEVDLDGRPLLPVVAHPLPPIYDAARWRRTVGALAGRPTDDLDRTVIVADFNVSTFHPPFRRFLARTRLRDVHRALGRGLTTSWPIDGAVPPFVRLDHALVGRDLTATAVADLDVPGSDHRGFTVTVSWAAP